MLLLNVLVNDFLSMQYNYTIEEYKILECFGVSDLLAFQHSDRLIYKTIDNKTTQSSSVSTNNVSLKPQDIKQSIEAFKNNIQYTNVSSKVEDIVEKSSPDFIDKVKNCNSIADLKKLINSHNISPLQNKALNLVLGHGSESADVMVIGEAPGADEDKEGLPFVGRSGKVLMCALSHINITIQNTFITNSIFWRPPGNRNPSISELKTCFPVIIRMMQILKPKFIVFVGKVSANFYLNNESSMRDMRAQALDLQCNYDESLHYIAKCWVLYHPAYLLRNPTKKKQMWFDLLDLKQALSN